MSLFEEFLSNCQNIEKIAEGGQKSVFKGSHRDYGHIVIKHSTYSSNNSLERIQREVDTLNEIDSVYYPKQHNFIIDTRNREFFIIEEYLEANNLSEVKDRFASDDDIIILLYKLICGLDIIWKKNIVHRDIKPNNILITDENEPRIIDLGIARFLDKSSLTATIADRGPATPIYAAPEQLLNRKSMINVRTDFFLLGLLILELMLGFHPFDPQRLNNDLSLPENIIEGNYYMVEEGHDSKLIKFVKRSLETKPYKRFRTVKDLITAIEMDKNIC
jgi:serine/threonine-protein kinase